MKNRPLLCAISVCVRVFVSGALVAVSLAEVTGVLQPQGCSEAGLVWGESQAAHPSPPPFPAPHPCWLLPLLLLPQVPFSVGRDPIPPDLTSPR